MHFNETYRGESEYRRNNGRPLQSAVPDEILLFFFPLACPSGRCIALPCIRYLVYVVERKTENGKRNREARKHFPVAHHPLPCVDERPPIVVTRTSVASLFVSHTHGYRGNRVCRDRSIDVGMCVCAISPLNRMRDRRKTNEKVTKRKNKQTKRLNKPLLRYLLFLSLAVNN